MSDQNPRASSDDVAVNLPARRRNPSATRSISNTRARRVELIRQGRPGAWKHGSFSVVANGPDVTVEHALIMASHPALDPVVDHRLVEDLSLARVQRNRALLAIEEGGMTSTLTSYLSRLMPLIERGERAVHEREQQRIKSFRSRPLVDLSMYRARTPEDEETDE